MSIRRAVDYAPPRSKKAQPEVLGIYSGAMFTTVNTTAIPRDPAAYLSEVCRDGLVKSAI